MFAYLVLLLCVVVGFEAQYAAQQNDPNTDGISSATLNDLLGQIQKSDTSASGGGDGGSTSMGKNICQPKIIIRHKIKKVHVPYEVVKTVPVYKEVKIPVQVPVKVPIYVPVKMKEFKDDKSYDYDKHLEYDEGQQQQQQPQMKSVMNIPKVSLSSAFSNFPGAQEVTDQVNQYYRKKFEAQQPATVPYEQQVSNEQLYGVPQIAQSYQRQQPTGQKASNNFNLINFQQPQHENMFAASNQFQVEQQQQEEEQQQENYDPNEQHELLAEEN